SLGEGGVDAGGQLAGRIVLPFDAEVVGEAQCRAKLERGGALAARQLERLAHSGLCLVASVEVQENLSGQSVELALEEEPATGWCVPETGLDGSPGCFVAPCPHARVGEQGE